MRNAGLDEAQAGIKIAGRNIKNLRYADDTTLMAESEEELKSLLMKMKQESEKAGLKLNIQKTKIMALGPITSWQIDGKNVETVSDFILGSKSNADSDCSYKIKTPALWKNSCDKPRQCIQKLRHHFADKGPYSQSYSFSSSHVQMWGLDHKIGWASKNWCFLIVVLEKTFESLLDGMEIKPVNPKGNQPWLLIGRTDAEAEAPILWQPDAKRWLTGKSPDAGKDWGQKSIGQQRIRWLDTIIDSIDRLWEIVKNREAWHAAVHRVTKSWIALSDWTATTVCQVQWSRLYKLYPI